MNELKVNIKYFDTPDYKQKRLQAIEKGDWIDLYAAEDKFVPLSKGEPNMRPTLIRLGIAMELPEGHEAVMAVRSSTFKTWGIIQTNAPGIIDNSYKGDNDEWLLAVVCLSPRNNDATGVHIKRGDKLCQFRIQKKMPPVTFTEVEHLNDADRGGFGSTGTE